MTPEAPSRRSWILTFVFALIVLTMALVIVVAAVVVGPWYFIPVGLVLCCVVGWCAAVAWGHVKTAT